MDEIIFLTGSSIIVICLFFLFYISNRDNILLGIEGLKDHILNKKIWKKVFQIASKKSFFRRGFLIKIEDQEYYEIKDLIFNKLEELKKEFEENNKNKKYKLKYALKELKKENGGYFHKRYFFTSVDLHIFDYSNKPSIEETLNRLQSCKNNLFTPTFLSLHEEKCNEKLSEKSKIVDFVFAADNFKTKEEADKEEQILLDKLISIELEKEIYG